VRVLSILESARVQLNVEVFRDDYETLRDYLKIHPCPSTDGQRRNYRKLRDFVSAYRRLYLQTDMIPIETVEEWEQWGDQPGEIFHTSTSIPRTPWIRSRFFRGRNRRYHAKNFWPERVHRDFRETWFKLEVHVPEYEYVEPGDGPYEPEEHVVIEAHMAPGRYIERDIATSQVQTLAVFLGLSDLEQLACSERPTLKEWLAARLWTQHRATPGGLLADGYKGPQDVRLLAFAKRHLMRFYGGNLREIIRKCGRDEETYGPGWRTSRGLWSKAPISGVGEAVDRAMEFLVNLPPWTNRLEEFLEACRALAEMRADGLVFRDPLDGTEFRWHHAQRRILRVGNQKIEVRPALRAGAINRRKLKQFLAPCLTHSLDATFSGLVLEELSGAGVTDIVALHDAWLVPETLPDPGDPTGVLDGSETLRRAIRAAGERWLRGLGCVYDQLVTDLGDDPTFGPFVKEIRGRWHARVEAKRWPKFLSQIK
jgi:hypothetical protein